MVLQNVIYIDIEKCDLDFKNLWEMYSALEPLDDRGMDDEKDDTWVSCYNRVDTFSFIKWENGCVFKFYIIFQKSGSFLQKDK